jgi:hypothetical protein
MSPSALDVLMVVLWGALAGGVTAFWIVQIFKLVGWVP